MFPVVSFGIAFSLLIGINKKAQEVDFVAPGWRRGGPKRVLGVSRDAAGPGPMLLILKRKVGSHHQLGVPWWLPGVRQQGTKCPRLSPGRTRKTTCRQACAAEGSNAAEQGTPQVKHLSLFWSVVC